MTTPDMETDAPPPALKRRHIVAATLGNALEFYDFVTYSFFAIQIGHTFFPSHNSYLSLMASLATFGAGFLTRPLGALVIGTYSDRAGRRPAMILSFTMMGVAIIAMALVPSYAAIGIAAPILVIVLRLVQGFSLGGEIGPNVAYLMEAAHPLHRGVAVSWQGASQGIAAAIGALVGAGLTQVLTPSALDAYGWRIAFLIGAATLPFGLWLRTNLPETLHRAESGIATAQSKAKTPLGMMREHWHIAMIGLVVFASGTIITYVSNYMTTYAQDTLHMNTTIAFMATVVGNGIGVVAAVLGGWLADKWGRRPMMLWPMAGMVVLTYPVFLWIVTTHGAVALLLGTALLSVISTFAFSAFYVALPENLPKRIRGGAFAVIYAVAIAAFGGTAQLVVTWLIHVTGNALAPAWYLVLASGIGLIAMAMLRESAPIKQAR